MSVQPAGNKPGKNNNRRNSLLSGSIPLWFWLIDEIFDNINQIKVGGTAALVAFISLLLIILTPVFLIIVVVHYSSISLIGPAITLLFVGMFVWRVMKTAPTSELMTLGLIGILSAIPTYTYISKLHWQQWFLLSTSVVLVVVIIVVVTFIKKEKGGGTNV